MGGCAHTGCSNFELDAFASMIYVADCCRIEVLRLESGCGQRTGLCKDLYFLCRSTAQPRALCITFREYLQPKTHLERCTYCGGIWSGRHDALRCSIKSHVPIQYSLSARRPSTADCGRSLQQTLQSAASSTVHTEITSPEIVVSGRKEPCLAAAAPLVPYLCSDPAAMTDR